MSVIIKCETVGEWQENSYLVEYNDEAWVIDPGDEFDKLDDAFKSGKLIGIINTHGHFDHIGAVQQFQEKYNIPFYIHSKDKQLVTQGNLYKKIAGGTSVFKTPVINQVLDDVNSVK